MRRPSDRDARGSDIPLTPPVDRRLFVRSLLVVGVGTLASCRRARQPVLAPQGLRDIAAEVATDAQSGLNVFPGGQEFIPGRQRLTFSLTTGSSQRPLEGAAAKLWMARGGDVTGPSVPRFLRYSSPGTGDPAGFYAVDVDIADDRGVVDLLVSAGGRYGFAVLSPRAQPTVPGVGQRARAVITPTTEDDQGVTNVCTRKPPCPLHDSSLHQALRARRPVVFTISSPLLCTSRTCGPVLAEVLAVNAMHGREAVFVHAEPYAGNTAGALAPTAVRWRLESEPWTFVIGPDARIAARFEGPVVASEIETALRAFV